MSHPISRGRLVVVALVAAVVRAAYLVWFFSGSPTIEPPSTLSAASLSAGYALAAGYGYTECAADSKASAILGDLQAMAESGAGTIDPAAVPPLPAADCEPRLLHPPGMSLLVAGIHRLGGGRASIGIHAIGTVLDVAAAVLVALLVGSVWSGRLGFASGLAYGLFAPVAYMASVSRSPEGLLSVFVIGTVYAIWRALHATGRRAWAWHLAAGIATGLGALLRPDYLLLPLWTVPAILLHRSWRGAIVSMAFVQAVAFTCLFPWAVRNHAHTGRWLFTSTSLGATLLGSLGEFRNPWGFGYEDEYRYRLAREHGIESPRGSEADLLFRRIYNEAVLEHPGGVVTAFVRRLPLAVLAPYGFGYVNPQKTRSFTQIRLETGMDRYDVLLHRPDYLLVGYWDRLLTAGVSALMLLAGVWMAWRERGRRALVWFLLSPHVYSIGVHMAVHVEPRYLLPSVYAFLVPSAWIVLTRGRRDPSGPAGAPVSQRDEPFSA